MTATDESAPHAAPAAAALDAAAAQALLQRQRYPVAVCDAAGQVLWCNPAWQRLAAAPTPPPAPSTPAAWPGLGAGDAAALRRALQADAAVSLGPVHIGRDPGGWWQVQVDPLPDGRRAVTLTGADAEQRHAAEAQRLAEWLRVAQDFGRIGLWERDARTLAGRWDRHVHRFWGLQGEAQAPDFQTTLRSIVPEDRLALDRAFRDSLQRAGTYAQRYRVRLPDGSLRMLHSQWEVRNGADGRPERALGVVMDDTEAWNLARVHGETVEQLGLAMELGHIVFWRQDLLADRVRFSAGAARLLGLPEQLVDLSTEDVRAMVHPDDRAALRAAVEQAVASGVPVDVQTRFRHADGGWRHMLTRRVLQRDAQGAPVALLGVGLDLSDRAQHEQRQAELVRELELTSTAAGIGYWNSEASTRRMRWSEQTYRLHGLSPDAEPPSINQWHEQYVHPDDRAALRAGLAAWLAGGGPILEQEIRIVRADGSIRHVISYTRREGTPGHHTYFGAFVDRTERRAAEVALRAAGERAALATRGAGMGTWDLDLVGGGTHWDEPMWRLRGLPPGPVALSEDERLALVHPDDREALVAAHERGARDGSLTTVEFRVRWPDGQWRWLASRSVTVRDDQGRALRRIGVNWDVTDARSAQVAREEKAVAERESAAKSRFLARMSHELRTPLNAVLGFTQLLLAGGGRADAATVRRHLERIESAGRHLLALIDDALDLSTLEGGEVRVVAEPVPLVPLVEQVLPMVALLAEQHRVGVSAGVLGGVAMADATRLRQVLLNLLTNAVKYNRDGGQVRVEAEAQGAQVVLRVSDTGRGMDEAQQRQAFEPFNRLGRERDNIEGTGIGLAIVKALVERMHGEVALHSLPGVGSRFEVRLPAAAAAVAASPDADTAAAAGRRPPRDAARPARLLYIEDNPVNVMLVQELVATRDNVQFDSAADGSSGVQRARESRPDLVLLDMQLPDIDGLETLRRLRAEPLTAGIPCIALSANAMPDDIERALRAGFADYWTKPLDFGRFMASLDALIDRAAARP